jgi:hypothetical protein
MGCGASAKKDGNSDQAATAAAPGKFEQQQQQLTQSEAPATDKPDQKSEAPSATTGTSAKAEPVKAPEECADAPSGTSKAQRKNAPINRTTATIDWSAADPEKWAFPEVEFNGSYSYATQPKVTEETEEISKGLSKIKASPQLYLGIFYQSDMVGWPADQQKYSLVHRDRSGFNVTAAPSAGFTWVCAKYQALPSDVTVVRNCHIWCHLADAYMPMSMGGKELGMGKMPGRGMGCADVPGLQLLVDANPNDIIQGGVGDCWLMSAISVLAEYDGAIEKLFAKNDVSKLPGEQFNTYTVTLYDLEKDWQLVDVVVDERLCTVPDGSKLQGCQPTLSGELWVCYLEKAVAAHCGGWDQIDGGQPTQAWRFLTGNKLCYTFQADDAKTFQCLGTFNPNTQAWDPLKNSPHGNGGLWPMKWPDVGGGGDIGMKVDKSDLFKRMVKFAENNFLMCAGTKAGSDKDSTDGIVDGHAYTILACRELKVGDKTFELIKVRNPWHSGEFTSGQWDDDGPGWKEYPEVKKLLRPVVADDGIFWLDKDEFFEYFPTIYLCAHDMSKFRT